MRSKEMQDAITAYDLAADKYVAALDRVDQEKSAEAAEDAIAAETEMLSAKAEMTRLRAWARPHWNVNV